ncbi:MMPL family transporter [Tepidiforma flava]|uniref:MMPL family transporter n=1 Tax=Tepidiforma flava TaxID=3004094 RepID=A0ABY7M5E4_9CHLR|nr:MMPL family transporter [Tepidiforma flava]WBL35230.1 MMPL family transporter [Tepidiforma flava]
MVQFNEQTEFGSEIYGLIAAVFILLIAFGSVVAMGVPIGAALFGLGTGLAIITVAARWVGFPGFSSQFAAMIGDRGRHRLQPAGGDAVPGGDSRRAVGGGGGRRGGGDVGAGR